MFIDFLIFWPSCLPENILHQKEMQLQTALANCKLKLLLGHQSPPESDVGGRRSNESVGRAARDGLHQGRYRLTAHPQQRICHPQPKSSTSSRRSDRCRPARRRRGPVPGSLTGGAPYRGNAGYGRLSQEYLGHGQETHSRCRRPLLTATEHRPRPQRSI